MSEQTLIHAELVWWLKDNQEAVREGLIPKAHAIFADPPYNLAFMGSNWDTHDSPQTFQSWVTEWATLLLDYVYPGAVLATFGGSRSYHRLACGLEDAGWEIFDEVAAYLYASGLPKSHNISKAIDREAGAEREVVGVDPNSANRTGTTFHGAEYKGGYTTNPEGKRLITAPSTDAAKQWDGFGTQLKPSRENIVLARAPRGNHTFAQLAQRFGTGALNIDGSRIATEDVTFRANSGAKGNGNLYGSSEKYDSETSPFGRFPANTLFVCECEGDQHDPQCPIAILNQQSGNRKAGSSKTGNEPSARTKNVYGKYKNEAWEGYGDEGGAARFFYCAKSSAWERSVGLEERNPHRTIKPLQLCEYICRLLLPPELDVPRRILIPFAGVASEMIGAHLAGWDEIVGIEMTDEYIPINNARRQWWSGFSSYEQAEKSRGIARKALAPEEKKIVQTVHF